jgi:hypothetical protein
MKTRIIQTKFWDDPTVIDAPVEAKFLFMYYLTCPHVGMTGIFEISNKEVELKTGLNEKQIGRAKKYLLENNKVRFYKTWVKIVNSEKYNNYAVGPKNSEAYNKELASINKEMLNALDSTIGVVSDSSDTNHNTEIINHKPEIRKEKGIVKGEKQSLEDLTPQILLEIADNYHLPIAFVTSKADDLRNWCASTGKTYKDYPATLRNWVKKDAQKLVRDQRLPSKSFDAVPYLQNQEGDHEPVAT